MSYPENHTPISWDDVQGVKHQNYSTWEAEAKALWIAASNALHKLEQSRFSNSEHEQAKAFLRAALEAKP